MSRLEIKVDGNDVAAEKMLRVASSTLKMLKAIEKSIAKGKGEKPSIRWRVDMMSGYSDGLIAFRAEAATGKAEDRQRVNEAWATVIGRLKETPGSASGTG